MVFQTPWAVFWRQEPSISFIPKKKKKFSDSEFHKQKYPWCQNPDSLTKGEKILGLEIPRDADPIYWSYKFPVFRKELKYPFKMILVHVNQGAVC